MEETQTPDSSINLAERKGPSMTFATEGQRCGFVFEDADGKCTAIKCTKAVALKFLGEVALKIAAMDE